MQDALHRLVPLVAETEREPAALDLSPRVALPFASECARGHADANAHRWRGLALYNVSRAVVRVASSKANREHFAIVPPGKATDKEVDLYLAMNALMGLRSQVIAELVFLPKDQPLELSELSIPDHSLTIFAGQKPDIELISRIRASGVERHFMAPAGERKSWRTVKMLDSRTGDALVEMRVPPSLREQLGLPSYVVARAIEYQRHGYPDQSFLTSLLEPRTWPRHELSAIHSERWASLSSSRMTRASVRPLVEVETPAEVLRRVGLLTSAYNLVRVALLEIAREFDQEPARMDFARALERLGADPLERALASASIDALAGLREHAADLTLADPGAPLSLSIEPMW